MLSYLVVLLDALSTVVHPAEVVLCRSATLLGGDLVQLEGLPGVRRQPLALEVELREAVGGVGMALVCAHAEPLARLCKVDGHAEAAAVKAADVEHRPR